MLICNGFLPFQTISSSTLPNTFIIHTRTSSSFTNNERHYPKYKTLTRDESQVSVSPQTTPPLYNDADAHGNYIILFERVYLKQSCAEFLREIVLHAQ